MEGAYAGMVERTYAGDVTSVRAGLRRRILLRLRESAKIIVPGAELAFGSNSKFIAVHYARKISKITLNVYRSQLFDFILFFSLLFPKAQITTCPLIYPAPSGYIPGI